VNAIKAMHPGTATCKFLPGTNHGFIRVGSKQVLLRLRQSDQLGAYVRENFNLELVELVDGWIKQITQTPQVGSN
jgi:hypothetical protein